MSRQYYKTSQDIYELFLNHPVMSQLLDEFEIDSNYTPPNPIKLSLVCDYLIENEEEILNNSLNQYYNDSTILENISNLYGFPIDATHSIDSYFSNPPKETPLTELLNYTLYYFKFAVTDNFYEKHILDFLPEYDREEIESKEKMKLTVQSLGRKLDDIEDKISRIKNIYDLDETPDELLDYLGQTLGYEREDVSLSGFSFRELLKNIIEIYKIKGTNYAFSFFFKFLGFEVNLKEFYFNRDSNNDEGFPGVDDTKVENFLTTKNPLFDTTHNSPASNLDQIRDLDDWDFELQSLIDAGCTNSSKYLRGIETYNQDTVTQHKNPWRYFKTNLIEYELLPFFDKINLTASSNETIKKYVKFLSPTYLFTWININLRPWVEDIRILTDSENDWMINIIKTIGDPRPTPEPWPAHPPGAMGVPENPAYTADPENYEWIRKTSNDPGFESPYLNYENMSDWLAIYDVDGDKLRFNIQNNMNLGGDDEFGSELIRNGTHIRQTSHPHHVSSAKHNGTKKLAFDQLSSNIKLAIDADIPENWTEYSIKSYPAVSVDHIPLENRTITNSNIINFSWEESEGCTGYHIQLSDNSHFSNILLEDESLTEPNITSTKLHNNSYYWRIRVKNDVSPEFLILQPNGLWSSWSSNWHFNLKTVPFPFNGEIISSNTNVVTSNYYYDGSLDATVLLDISFKLETEVVTGASNYRIQLSLDENILNIFLDKENKFNTFDMLLENGVYYWRSKSQNRQTEEWSDWSEILSFTIQFPFTI